MSVYLPIFSGFRLYQVKTSRAHTIKQQNTTEWHCEDKPRVKQRTPVAKTTEVRESIKNYRGSRTIHTNCQAIRMRIMKKTLE